MINYFSSLLSCQQIQMNSIPALLLFLVIGILSQIHSTPNTSLIQLLEQSRSTNPLQASALLILFQSHPELQNYTIISISISNISNSSATDFEITLGENKKQLIAIVSVSQFQPSFLVSLHHKSQEIQFSANPLYNYSLNSNSFSNQYPMTSKSVITMPQFNLLLIPAQIHSDYINRSINLSGSVQNNVLGGFKKLQNLQDSRFKLAVSFAKKKRHNLINYNINHVEYQVVSGVNYFIEFIGFDKLTKILVVVAIDLKMRPNLIYFQVSCIKQINQCTEMTAPLIYGSIQLLMMVHTQLLDYTIHSILIQHSNGLDSLQLLVTLQNISLKIKALADLKVQNKQLSIMSYYTYPFEL